MLLNDIKAERAEQAAASIRAEGGTCLATGGDVANVEDTQALVAKTVAEFDRVDIAVANAALFLLSPEASHITGQTILVDGGWTLTSPIP